MHCSCLPAHSLSAPGITPRDRGHPRSRLRQARARWVLAHSRWSRGGQPADAPRPPWKAARPDRRPSSAESACAGRGACLGAWPAASPARRAPRRRTAPVRAARRTAPCTAPPPSPARSAARQSRTHLPSCAGRWCCAGAPAPCMRVCHPHPPPPCRWSQRQGSRRSCRAGRRGRNPPASQ